MQLVKGLGTRLTINTSIAHRLDSADGGRLLDYSVFYSDCCLCLSDAGPELLLSGHSLIMATLDFLMVAQCASLVHKVVIAGWELLQFPWVRALAGEHCIQSSVVFGC